MLGSPAAGARKPRVVTTRSRQPPDRWRRGRAGLQEPGCRRGRRRTRWWRSGRWRWAGRRTSTTSPTSHSTASMVSSASPSSSSTRCHAACPVPDYYDFTFCSYMLGSAQCQKVVPLLPTHEEPFESLSADISFASDWYGETPLHMPVKNSSC